MSDDAIQDLVDHMNLDSLSMMWGPRTQGIIASAQSQHTSNRNVIASLRSSLEGRAAEVSKLQAERDMWRAESQRGCWPTDAQVEIDSLRTSLLGYGQTNERLMAEHSAVVQSMSLTLDHTTARAEKAEAEVAQLQARVEQVQRALFGDGS